MGFYGKVINLAKGFSKFFVGNKETNLLDEDSAYENSLFLETQKPLVINAQKEEDNTVKVTFSMDEAILDENGILQLPFNIKEENK